MKYPTPSGKYTIEEAAKLWIQIIEWPDTDSPQTDKDALVGRIRSVSHRVPEFGTGQLFSFVAATNKIKAEIRKDIEADTAPPVNPNPGAQGEENA